jgi:hypothetical protein
MTDAVAGQHHGLGPPGSSGAEIMHHWLWANGIASFYGGSSQVHLGPGPRVDEASWARICRGSFIDRDRMNAPWKVTKR